MSSQQSEVDLDGHTEHTGRQATALLSAAMAAAQSAAQIMAQRERQRQRAADDLARQAELVRRGLERHDELHARSVQRQAEQAARAAEQAAQRQQRAAQDLRDKQWSMKPSEQWWHEAPQSAADAWASAEAHRDTDPLAARAAEQWETIFTREGIDLADVRARAERMRSDPNPAADSSEATTATEPGNLADVGTVAAEATVFTGAAAAAVDEVEHRAHEAWTACADGAPAARIGGLGVSKPPSQVHTHAAAIAPDPGATTAAVPQPSVDVSANVGAGLGQ